MRWRDDYIESYSRSNAHDPVDILKLVGVCGGDFTRGGRAGAEEREDGGLPLDFALGLALGLAVDFKAHAFIHYYYYYYYL